MLHKNYYKKKGRNHIPTANESTHERRVHKTHENDNLLFHNKVKKVINNKSIKKILIIRKIQK